MFSSSFLVVQITDTFTNKFTTKMLDLVLSLPAPCVCGVELIILCHFSLLIPSPRPEIAALGRHHDAEGHGQRSSTVWFVVVVVFFAFYF